MALLMKRRTSWGPLHASQPVHPVDSGARLRRGPTQSVRRAADVPLVRAVPAAGLAVDRHHVAAAVDGARRRAAGAVDRGGAAAEHEPSADDRDGALLHLVA